MANGDIGYSWQIGANNPGGTGGSGSNGNGSRGISPQQAVKILSLRIPERPSPRAIAPQALLTSKGSGAAGAQGLDSMVAALMQAFKPPVTSGAPQVPGMPPSATPGSAGGAPQVPPFRAPGPDGRPRPDVTPVPVPGGGPSPQPPIQQPPPVLTPPVQQPPVVTPQPRVPTPPRVIPGDDERGGSAPEPPPLIQSSTPAPWSGPKWDTAFDDMTLSDVPMLARRRGLF